MTAACVLYERKTAVSRARGMRGLMPRRGKVYIFFLDPDDWVEPDAAEQLADAADSEDADIVIFGSTLDTYDASGRLVGRSTAMPPLEGVFSRHAFSGQLRQDRLVASRNEQTHATRVYRAALLPLQML